MRGLRLVVVVTVLALATACVALWYQRAELQTLRHKREVLDELCRREASHARFLLASAQGDLPKNAVPLREFGVGASLEACLPGATFGFREADGCWLRTGDPKCALPVLTAIVAEFDRRWR